eukprot:IDg3733t1
MAPKPRHYLSIAQKKMLLAEWDRNVAEGKQITLESMAAWATKEFKLSFTPDKSTMSRIRKNRSKIQTMNAANGRKKSLRLSCPALDAALAAWVTDMFVRRVAVSESAIVLKATKLLAGVNA